MLCDRASDRLVETNVVNCIARKSAAFDISLGRVLNSNDGIYIPVVERAALNSGSRKTVQPERVSHRRRVVELVAIECDSVKCHGPPGEAPQIIDGPRECGCNLDNRSRPYGGEMYRMSEGERCVNRRCPRRYKD